MKTIILISTLLFVSFSVIGIASYYQYNASLRERGLYAPEKKSDSHQSAEEEMSGANDHSKQNEELQTGHQTVATNVRESPKEVLQSPPPKKATSRKRTVIVRKKAEREIDFSEFSRAPLREPEVPEEAPVVEEVVEGKEAPVETIPEE